MKLDFRVTIDWGRHLNGDTVVTVPVTTQEYALLQQCCREDKSIDSFGGLEDLWERIYEAIRKAAE